MFVGPVERSLLSKSPGGIKSANLVWIFGAGRSGSIWLARMMKEIEGQTVWFEPRVGELFDPGKMQVGQRDGTSQSLPGTKSSGCGATNPRKTPDAAWLRGRGHG